MTTIRVRVRGVLCWGFGVLSLALAPRAQARELGGATQVQLKSELFEYESYSADAIHGHGTTFGLFNGPSGVELGYFVSKHVQLGAGLFFLRNHFHDGPSSQRN